MKILTSDVVEPQLDDTVIYINQSTRDFISGSKPFMFVILRGFRRCLRAQTSSATTAEQIMKLQGKLELIGELENFFKQ